MGRSCRTGGTYSGSLRSREDAGTVVRARGVRGTSGGRGPLTVVTHVVPQQALGREPLGAVRTLETLLWGGAGRESDGADGQGGAKDRGTLPGRREPPVETWELMGATAGQNNGDRARGRESRA